MGLGDLQKRARVDRSAMGTLAESGALQSLVGPRRQAIWAARGLYDLPLFRGLERTEQVDLPTASGVDNMKADYQSMGSAFNTTPLGWLEPRSNKKVLCALRIYTISPTEELYTWQVWWHIGNALAPQTGSSL